ncbi:MAG: acetoacetate--CoA ligase, partial [Acidobacteria bacterium]|nr:acetoacetate--CoA ligase [Acidobacteriota bacterium]
MSNTPRWTPDPARIADANLTRFTAWLETRAGQSFQDYAALHHYSVTHRGEFWSAVWEFCGVVGDKGGRIVIDGDQMPGAGFFPDARLNVAENLLRRDDDSLAIVAMDETGAERELTWTELRSQVAACAQQLRDAGVQRGDRVAGFMANVPEAIIAALAAASLGAVWSSCSPDFGVQGVLDRFGQIEPKVLVAISGYHYGGKYHDCRERVQAIAQGLPSVARVLMVPDDFAPPTAEAGPLVFEQLPFNHPLYVLYSSGTTGVPKCIVHGHGGTLLQHLKEHQLQANVRAGDRVFYFTTCGWMMWNWLVSALASRATLLLFDGNPFWPRPEALLEFCDAEEATLFGTSAKYIAALDNVGADPAREFSLASMRTVTSTGSPLAPEGFDYVYEHIKRDVCLSSIAGGTDIVGCFVGGNPVGPVWRGE